jgi:integrase
MLNSQSTAPAPSDKPAKPYPEFPLFAHAAGVWAKKIRGRMHYFGPWSDPDAALDKYLKEKDALHAGRTPRPDPEALTVKALANAFLNHKQAALDAGEIVPRTWQEFKAACDLLVAHFGKGRRVDDLAPDDFADLRKQMAKRWGPVTLGNAIQRIRSICKYGFDGGLIDRPVRFGREFKRPSKKTLRIDRTRKGEKLFAAEEVRRMVDAAPAHLRAMILLGINCAFGPSDLGQLPLSALDLDGGWVRYPRPKTGVERRCPLWPETVAALKEALAGRPAPKDPALAGRVFVTKYGGSWHKTTRDTPISNEVRKLLDSLGISGRKGLGIYTLRHVFRTVADEVKDQPAADLIMGHESSHMSTVYRERISDGRLRAVVDHVRAWLFGEAEKEGAKS